MRRRGLENQLAKKERRTGRCFTEVDLALGFDKQRFAAPEEKTSTKSTRADPHFLRPSINHPPGIVEQQIQHGTVALAVGSKGGAQQAGIGDAVGEAQQAGLVQHHGGGGGGQDLG